MKTYKVMRMTRTNYIKFMNGEWNYDYEYLYIEADTPEEAVKKAKANGYYVYGTAKTLEEIEAEEKAFEEYFEEKKRKKVEAKAKKEENELKKANALGITVEELKELKKLKAKAKKYEKELAEIEETFKKLEERKNYLKKWLKENEVE